MNNVTTKGETQGFTRGQFEQGQITAEISGHEMKFGTLAKTMRYRAKHDSPAIFTKAP